MYTIALISVSVIATLLLTFLVLNLSSGEKKIRYNIASSYGVGDAQFLRSMGELLGPPICQGNQVTALLNGDQIFPAMLAAIRSAKKTITFETFIYWSGSIGLAFAEALAERARAGVKVHVLLDWVGSGKMDENSLGTMRNAGIEIEKYRPLRWYNLSRMNHRTHRKLLVVDGTLGFTGGVGIADQWLGNAESPSHWRDSHYRMEGQSVGQMQAAFMDNWLKVGARVLHDEEYFPKLESAGSSLAQVFVSSAREGSESVRLMYLLSIAAARRTILLQNAYFVPDTLSVESLIEARKRGVRVEIIVPGAHTDAQVVQKASRSRWGPLLEAGVKIYEYQPTMYHCKVMIVDDLWVSVGSTNFDNRSFRLNDEANLNVFDERFAKEQVATFEADKARSRCVTLAEWKKRPLWEKLSETISGLVRSQM